MFALGLSVFDSRMLVKLCSVRSSFRSRLNRFFPLLSCFSNQLSFLPFTVSFSESLFHFCFIVFSRFILMFVLYQLPLGYLCFVLPLYELILNPGNTRQLTYVVWEYVVIFCLNKFLFSSVIVFLYMFLIVVSVTIFLLNKELCYSEFLVSFQLLLLDALYYYYYLVFF